MTGAAKNTVTKLLVDLGQACADFQDGDLRAALRSGRGRRDMGLLLRQEQERPRAVQGDARLRRRVDVHRRLRRHEAGSVLAGRRANRRRRGSLSRDLAERMAGRIQLARTATACTCRRSGQAFGQDVDWAQIQKNYASNLRRAANTARRSASAPNPRPAEGRPGSRPDLDQLRRAAEPHDADGDAALHAADQRLQPRKWRTSPTPSRLHFIHYNFARPHASLQGPVSADPGDGSRGCRSRLDAGRDPGTS